MAEKDVRITISTPDGEFVIAFTVVAWDRTVSERELAQEIREHLETLYDTEDVA